MDANARAGTIALFGGTFDPVHLGHLRVAWDAAHALGCPVRLVPCATPSHRREPAAGAVQRIEMLKLALAGQDRLVLDPREVGRGGISYTVDTLRELRAEVGDARPIAALIGADAFVALPSWREWRELFVLAHLVVLTRAGHSPEWPAALRDAVAGRETDDAAALAEAAAGKVLRLPVTPLEISASAVRAELAGGREPRWLVPDAVLDYIVVQDLYRTP